MAKVKFGQGVAKIMGTIGGTIFSQNASGNYMKNYNTPTNPQSPAQLAVRAFFSAISTAWSGLTQVQRDGWSALAATLPFENSVGDTYYLSGKGLFQKSNTVMLNVDESAIEDTPDDFKTPDGPGGMSIAVADAAGTFILSADDANVLSQRTWFCDAAPPSNAARNNNNSLFKRIHFIKTGQPLDTVDIATEYQAVFGAFTEGQKIEIRCGYIDLTNGMISTYVKADTLVVA